MGTLGWLAQLTDRWPIYPQSGPWGIVDKFVILSGSQNVIVVRANLIDLHDFSR